MGWRQFDWLVPAIAWLAFATVTTLDAAPARSAESYAAEVFTQDGASVLAVAFSPDGSWVAIAEADGPVHVKDTASGLDTVLLKGDGANLNLLAASSTGDQLVTVSADDMIRVWALPGGREIAAFKPEHRVNSIVFSPDGKQLLHGGSDGAAHLSEIATGREVALFGPHEGDVVEAALSADGTLAVTAAADNTARVWDVASARQLVVVQHAEAVYSVAISPDRARIITATSDATARVFDAANGSELMVLKGHEGQILDAAFSPDGTRIATASADRTARLWDSGGQHLATLSGHLDQVYHVVFSTDGQRVLTAGRDATGRVWTRIVAAGPSGEIGGVWYQTEPASNPLPVEAARQLCLANPAMVHADGLVVFFSGSDTSPPEAVQHLRCTSELKCQLYPGAPAEGLEAFGEAELSFADDTGSLCIYGACVTIARCPPLAWTDEQRASGFAADWEARVLAGAP